MDKTTEKRRITLDKNTPPRRKLTGHEYLLQRLKNEGKDVTLFLVSGDRAVGKIESFDKFTITIQQGQSVTCFFKHAIESFQ